MTHHIDLDTIVLEKGSHRRREDGVCLMEAVAWWAGERHSDQPVCTSPVIAAFLRRWQDDLDDEGRQKLKRYVPLVVGTNTGQADEETRAWLVTDWLVRVHTPAWLRLAGVRAAASALEALPPLTDAGVARLVQPKLDEVRAAAAERAKEADAARDAARDAAWDAARDAAWDAARDAAWAAARDAAWAAARDALQPTVVELQASAFDLLDRLIAVGAASPAAEEADV